MALAILIGLQVLGSNYFQYVGKAKQATVLSLLRQVIVYIPLLLILPNFWGLDGVWWAGPVGDLISTSITLILFAREFKHLPKEDQIIIDDQQWAKLEREITADMADGVIAEAAEEGKSLGLPMV